MSDTQPRERLSDALRRDAEWLENNHGFPSPMTDRLRAAADAMDAATAALEDADMEPHGDNCRLRYGCDCFRKYVDAALTALRAQSRRAT